MSDKLVVKNFGPIKDIELDLKPIMVFIGPQATGKSTIAKLIAIFKDYEFINNFSDYQNFFKRYNIHNFFEKGTYFEFVCEKYCVQFRNEKFELHPSEKFWNEMMELYTHIKLEDVGLEKPAITFTNGKSSSKKIQKNGFLKKWKKFDDRTKRILIMNVLDQDIVYIPAERLLIPSIVDASMEFLDKNITLPKSITNFGMAFQIARKSKNKFPVDFLNVTYKYQNGDVIYFNKNGQSDLLNLSESASGMQALIPMFIVIEHLSNKSNMHPLFITFIIEEPELNLYPITQKHLVGYLIEHCTKGNNSLIITTHSPYILTSLNNLLFSYRVSKKQTEKITDIKKIIPQNRWINPNDFTAYYVQNDGKVRNIFNIKTGLISENDLDDASEEILGDYDALMEIYKSQ